MFYSLTFMFRSMINFKSMFVYVVRDRLKFIFIFLYGYPVVPNHFWKYGPLSFELCCHLCKKISWAYICVDLFLDVLFWFIDLYIYPYINKHRLDYCSLRGNLESVSIKPLSLFFVFKIVLVVLDPLYFHMNFRIS